MQYVAKAVAGHFTPKMRHAQMATVSLIALPKAAYRSLERASTCVKMKRASWPIAHWSGRQCAITKPEARETLAKADSATRCAHPWLIMRDLLTSRWNNRMIPTPSVPCERSAEASERSSNKTTASPLNQKNRTGCSALDWTDRAPESRSSHPLRTHRMRRRVQYRPMPSATMASKSGSSDTMWVSSRCGRMSCLRQMAIVESRGSLRLQDQFPTLLLPYPSR